MMHVSNLAPNPRSQPGNPPTTPLPALPCNHEPFASRPDSRRHNLDLGVSLALQHP